VEQNDVWIILGLLGAAIPLIALARRAGIPYPIVLVAGGLVLGFVPALPHLELDPNLVLIIFLPPLLYWEAITAPTDVMRKNRSQIWALAFGLVIVSAVVVAVVAHATIANLSWAMAFVLGAIVSPTDELASVPVLERLRMPRHLIAIVVGESLLNDASALILYAFAVTAAVTGTFSLGEALPQFVIRTLGGIAVGLIVGRLAVEGWRRIKDTQLQGVISFEVSYLAYLLADRFGLSGVLAVVYGGIYVNRFTPRVLTPASRLQTVGYWETIVFLINAVLFLMVGMQLHDLAQNVFIEYSWKTVALYALVVNLTVIGVRFAWILGVEYVPFIGAASEHSKGDWRHAIIASWSGLRGAVSLAAALALPVSIVGGGPLPHRHLVIFLTFSVILVTLVLGGLTLPWIVKVLTVPEDAGEEEDEVRDGMLGMSEAALRELAIIEGEGQLDAAVIERLRRRYEHRREHADGHAPDEDAVLDAERRLLAAERKALLEMRDRGSIDNTVLRRLQHVLDISEERLGRGVH
jgi:CPA1 family monovalent cation:H+ antiporter